MEPPSGGIRALLPGGARQARLEFPLAREAKLRLGCGAPPLFELLLEAATAGPATALRCGQLAVSGFARLSLLSARAKVRRALAAGGTQARPQ